jgi:Leucine-rich repeat (LRR) protein
MLAGLSYAKFLNLGHNQIADIDANTFQPVPRLVTLMLRKNSLRRLQSGVFKQLRMLRHLDLSSNRIDTLADGAFRGLERIEDLNMDDNELASLEAKAFNVTTPRLVTLSVRSNRLRTADLRGLLEVLDDLRQLDLSANRISLVIPPSGDRLPFDDAETMGLGQPQRHRGLTQLSLADNVLETLDEDVVEALRQNGDGAMRVDGNPWMCDCRIQWLVGLLSGEDRRHAFVTVDSADKVLCKSPSYIGDRKLQSLTTDDLLCLDT